MDNQTGLTILIKPNTYVQCVVLPGEAQAIINDWLQNRKTPDYILKGNSHNGICGIVASEIIAMHTFNLESVFTAWLAQRGPTRQQFPFGRSGN
jgi:hypothetical protein